MRWDAAEAFYPVMILIMLARVLLRYVQSREVETYEEMLISYAGDPTNDPEDENEEMTPTYMPAPREAGDGGGLNQKEIYNEI